MATDLNAVVKLEVPVIVRVGERHATMDEILALGPGAILELEKPAEEQLTLLINNKPIGSGEAVKVGENFGIRITAVEAPSHRVQAMATDLQ